MAQSNTTSGGIGLFGVLGVVFIALKLANAGDVAAWGWGWVLAPFWGPLAVVVGGLAVYAAALGLIWLVGSVAQAISEWAKRRDMAAEQAERLRQVDRLKSALEELQRK